MTDKRSRRDESLLRSVLATRASLLSHTKSSPNGRRVGSDDFKLVPSLVSDKSCETPRKESQHYTGTVVIGVATMHKSNAVPVINQQQAEEIAKMRRG